MLRRSRTTLPAWPLDALLWGFPLWWLLGLTPFIVVLIAALMAVLLLARRQVGIIGGVGPWLAFVAWVVPCALMLDSALRLVGYGQRFANYLAVAVVLVYVVNARERLTATRVIGGLTALWVTVVVGGYLGVLFPDVRLTTPVGILLPGALTGNEYVADLVFPPLAEVQHPWGAEEPYQRPAAPFPYTNGWGSAMALLTPVAIATMLSTADRRVRWLLGAVAVAAVVPAAAALNRGLFMGLAIAAAYVAVRLLFRGSILPFVGLVGVGVAGFVGLAVGGVLDSLEQRADFGSTDSRAQIYAETWQRTLQSPIFGYGAPRPSESIGVSVGTQGHVWMLMFSYGLVGLALFLWFLYGAVLRTWRAPGTQRLWLHATLVVASATILFYGLDTMQLLSVVLVAAVLLRDPAVVARPRSRTATAKTVPA